MSDFEKEVLDYKRARQQAIKKDYHIMVEVISSEKREWYFCVQSSLFSMIAQLCRQKLMPEKIVMIMDPDDFKRDLEYTLSY